MKEKPLIGVLYESDEWSDWKLAHELDAAVSCSYGTSVEDVQASDDEGMKVLRHVRMIDMLQDGCIERTNGCDLLVSRVFASAVFRGNKKAHENMERMIAHVQEHRIPMVNPARAHGFEIDKAHAGDVLSSHGVRVPAIISKGKPAGLLQHARDWRYPVIAKPNCGGRTTFTSVMHDVDEARDFFARVPDMELIVEEYIEAKDGFITRVEVIDGDVALAVKRSITSEGLSSYHAGSTYELYPDCPPDVLDAVLKAAELLDIGFGSFDVIEANGGNFIIDANSVSNVSQDCTQLFEMDLMAEYAKAIVSKAKREEWF